MTLRQSASVVSFRGLPNGEVFEYVQEAVPSRTRVHRTIVAPLDRPLDPGIEPFTLPLEIGSQRPVDLSGRRLEGKN